MSELDIEKQNEVVDLYKEHDTHQDEWLKNCSLCYEDKIATLAKYKKMNGYNIKKEFGEILEHEDEMSAHPEPDYWGN